MKFTIHLPLNTQEKFRTELNTNAYLAYSDLGYAWVKKLLNVDHVSSMIHDYNVKQFKVWCAVDNEKKAAEMLLKYG